MNSLSKIEVKTSPQTLEYLEEYNNEAVLLFKELPYSLSRLTNKLAVFNQQSNQLFKIGLVIGIVAFALSYVSYIAIILYIFALYFFILSNDKYRKYEKQLRENKLLMQADNLFLSEVDSPEKCPFYSLDIQTKSENIQLAILAEVHLDIYPKHLELCREHNIFESMINNQTKEIDLVVLKVLPGEEDSDMCYDLLLVKTFDPEDIEPVVEYKIDLEEKIHSLNLQARKDCLEKIEKNVKTKEMTHNLQKLIER